jgi:hypothetical protein
MAVFNNIEGDEDEFDLNNLDCGALVYHSGIATITDAQRTACRFWLGNRARKGTEYSP